MVKSTVTWPTLTVLLFLINVYGQALLPRRPRGGASAEVASARGTENFEEELGMGRRRDGQLNWKWRK